MAKHHWVRNWVAGVWDGWRCLRCSQVNLNLPWREPSTDGCGGSNLPKHSLVEDANTSRTESEAAWVDRRQSHRGQ